MLLRALPVRTTATDGLLLVDKGPGVTSHDVVALARRSLRTRRIGHTGTLDPFATGLLVLLVGRATRLARYVDDEPKVYDATISFGAETSTDDPTGEVTRIAAPPSAKDVDEAIDSLTGSILQRPPDYSAKKVAGKRAYTAARAGTPTGDRRSEAAGAPTGWNRSCTLNSSARWPGARPRPMPCWAPSPPRTGASLPPSGSTTRPPVCRQRRLCPAAVWPGSSSRPLQTLAAWRWWPTVVRRSANV